MSKKGLITTGITILMLATATGCGDQKAASQNTVLPIADEANKNTVLPDQSDETKDSTANTPIPDNKDDFVNNATDVSLESDSGSNAPDILPPSVSTDTTIIGGKVRSVAENSFVISRTLWEDSDDGGSYVSIPEEGSPEEELVTIRCTDTTTFECWTIQGGGAGITTDEASFSDIQRGGGLEAEGNFDGNEFIAERVIIEVYE